MNHKHKDFINKLNECAAACDYCLDACLDEDDLKKMVSCIRTDRDCAKITRLTASMVASNSKYADGLVKECEEICRACAEECEQHETEHCKQCAEACRACEEACKSYSGVAA